MFKNRVEILAPCGSYEIMVAAINAGANACYFGGNRFGARAYAQNFDEQTVLSAIDYAHERGVSLYMTVNTLFKNEEIGNLYDYLLPFYEAGLDAVIVQDLGVFAFIRRNFPDIAVHLSTQMNITSVYGAKLMETYGATRVVPARELSLSELAKIKQETDLELEVFCHGAMCYSYSGQCLMSSLAGGRSGNRGRCAQTCRKAYDGKYLLSMKDLSAITILPDMLKAGVDSLKIEGRMKNEAYVASAVHSYREMVELYYAGEFSEKQAEEKEQMLANIFCRGNFTHGYLINNKSDMVTIDAPNHTGVNVGTLKAVKDGKAILSLAEEVYPQDVLSIQKKNREQIEVTIGIGGKKGQEIRISAPETKNMQLGSKVRRTRCENVLSYVKKEYAKTTCYPISLSGRFTAKVGQVPKFELLISLYGKQFESAAEGENPIDTASSKAPDISDIQKKLSAFGGSGYVLADLDLNIDDNAFVPAGILKPLRRAALNNLKENILQSFRRKASACSNLQAEERSLPQEGSKTYIFLQTKEQWEAFCNYASDNPDNDFIVILPERLFLSENGNYAGQKYLALPEIIGSSYRISPELKKKEISGIYIRNLDGLALLQNEFSDELANKELILANSLYAYNDEAVIFAENLAEQVLNTSTENLLFELPEELNEKELYSLSERRTLAPVYGYTRVMLSAQCAVRSKKGCSRKNEIIKINDGEGHAYYVQAVCESCHSVIYNGVPLDLRKEYGKYLNRMYNFTVENGEELVRILSDGSTTSHTTGHLKRGVL